MPDQKSTKWLCKWRAAYSVLSMQSSGGGSTPIAVMLLDIHHDRLLFRFLDNLATIAADESLPVLEGMRNELASWASENGATSTYLLFLDTLSNAVTISAPREVPPDVDLADYLDRVFTQEVEKTGFARG